MTRLTCALMLVLLLTTGCNRAGERLGAGQDVDFCRGWLELDMLDEPDTGDRDETLRWAQGVLRILDRIDTRREVDDDPVPRSVEELLTETEQPIERFVDDLEAADDGDGVATAVRVLADSGFDEAADQLTNFKEAKCR